MLRSKPPSAAKVKPARRDRGGAFNVRPITFSTPFLPYHAADRIEPDRDEDSRDNLFIPLAAHPGVAVNSRDNAESPSG